MLYRCPKCNHLFDGKRNNCPNCGVPFYYGSKHELLEKKVEIYDEIIDKEKKNFISYFLPGVKGVLAIKFAVSILLLALSLLLLFLPFIYLIDYGVNITSIAGARLFYRHIKHSISLVNGDIDTYCFILFLAGIVIFLQALYLFFFSLFNLKRKRSLKYLFVTARNVKRNAFIRFLDRTSQASYNALFCLIYLLVVPFEYNSLVAIIFTLVALILFTDIFCNIHFGSIQREMRKAISKLPPQAYLEK